jgi:hypothetical protein
VKEQSHKDEMSAALRGDFARLRDRGVSATLVPHDARRAASVEPEAPGTEPSEEQHGPEPITGVVTEAPEDAEPERQQEPERSGWLSRLVGR